MAFTAMNNRPASQAAPAVPIHAAAPVAHAPEIDVAFAGNQELRKRVHAAIGNERPFPARLAAFLT